jgi:methylmalonyl-CoA epimerase
VKITGIDHVGILVADIEEALRFYSGTLGLEAGPIETFEEPPIRRACVRVGESELELIEARDAGHTMIRFLPHRHPGLYHVALRVDDVDRAADGLQAAGVPLIDGRREDAGMRIQYLHPDAAQGSMIELVTRKR